MPSNFELCFFVQNTVELYRNSLTNIKNNRKIKLERAISHLIGKETQSQKGAALERPGKKSVFRRDSLCF